MIRSFACLGIVAMSLGLLAFSMASISTVAPHSPPAAPVVAEPVPSWALQPRVAGRSLEAAQCQPAGPCELCLPVERHRDYCRSTGRRQEFVCRSEFDESASELVDSNEPERVVIYKPCARTAQDRMKAVLWFEICMAIIGTLAMCGVSQQKRSNQTLYDIRLHRRRGGGGGGGG
eukprot:CAMPEP_0118973768 /NCGR_PEP_ID=MMETSP1173-20130426/10900_1 /TAXON_ID=1034831 /ORGANISM="Rhizochromulina marina cf, Strain CCMP1243" /LENGTH=174 /DNA_ID=CAMNT_0006923461 /DNA_START=152 /DNA_END=673 /DNA_ORIENTATION=-